MGQWSGSGKWLDRYDERFIEDILVGNLDLLENGLNLIGRQVDVGCGVIDVLAVDIAGRPVVIELKRDTVNCEAVGQCLRYMRALELALQTQAELLADEYSQAVVESYAIRDATLEMTGVRGFVCAPNVTDDALILIDVLSGAGQSIRYVKLAPVAILSREQSPDPSLSEEVGPPDKAMETLHKAIPHLRELVEMARDTAMAELAERSSALTEAAASDDGSGIDASA